jgi:hypothetical protein
MSPFVWDTPRTIQRVETDRDVEDLSGNHLAAASGTRITVGDLPKNPRSSYIAVYGMLTEPVLAVPESSL